MASKAPVDWTQIPQTFGHDVWSFGLLFGDGFSKGSFELRHCLLALAPTILDGL